MTQAKIPTRQLGINGPTVGKIGYGAMGIGAYYGKTDESEAFKALSYALDRGLTYWDTADIYGNSEEALGRWFTATGRRSEVFLATKFGSYDVTATVPVIKPISKPSYIRSAVERSLFMLKTDYIDLYYQHRVDPDVPIEIVLEALRPFIDSGEIRWLGLSECSAQTLRRAKAVKGVGEKVIAVQMEYSPFELAIENSGVAATAKELGMAVVAYSPLSRGLISGKYRSRAAFEPTDLRLVLPRFNEENFSKNVELADKFQSVADKYKATSSQVALAWILAEHPHFIPIPGSRDVVRVEENGSSAELTLDPEDVKALRKLIDTADVQGARYPVEFEFPADSMPLSEWKGD